MADQTTTERFIADTSEYVRRVEEAARQADAFGRSNSETALAARRMGLAASEAADKAGRAMRDAADAAQKLARGEITVDEASQAATKASRDLERSEIAQAVAARAAAKATNDLADQQRAAARAAVEAAGIERLASLRAQGAVRDHNLLLTHLRREYGLVGNDARAMSTLTSRAFALVQRGGMAALTAIDSGLQAAISSWPVLLGVAVAGLIALPAVAIAAGGAITLALGGALAGIGILAVAKSKEVKAAFGSLASEAKRDAAAWAAPFKPALVGIANSAKSVLSQLGPTMTAMFAQMAPAVQRFTEYLGKGLLSLSQSFPGISAGFTQLLDVVGPNLPQLFSDIGMGLEAIAKAAGDHATEFGQLIVVIGRFVNGLGQMIAWLINAGSAVQRFFGILDTLGGTGARFQASLAGMDAASSATGAAIGAFGTTVQTSYTAMQLASMGADELKAALDNLAGKTLSAREALAHYALSIFAMNKALHDNGSAHGFATVKGVANEQALTKLAEAANKNKEAMAADGKTTQQVAAFMDQARAAFITSAEKMHYSSAAANALADKLFGVGKAARSIPAKTTTDILGNINDLENKVSAAKARLATVPASRRASVLGDIRDLEAKIAAAKRALASLQGKTVTVDYTYITHHRNDTGAAAGGYIGRGYAAGGMIKRYAAAGYVSGPGSGTSDDIDAKLSNGEYVMRAASVAANRAALDAANYSGAQLVAVGKQWGKATVSPPSPWGHATYDPWGHDTWKPGPPKPAPHHGLQSYGSAYGQQQVTNNHIYVAGSVTTENDLLNMIQTRTLQTGKAFTLPAGR